MKTQTDKSSFLLPTIAVIAVMLLGIAGFARIMGWLPNSIGDFANIRAIEVLSAASAMPVAEPEEKDLLQAPGNARRRARCPECGVIVSVREIGARGPNASHGTVGQELASNDNGIRGTSAGSYEFSVRLNGGARRVIIDANPASWRLGERVIIIDGTNPSQP